MNFGLRFSEGTFMPARMRISFLTSPLGSMLELLVSFSVIVSVLSIVSNRF